MFASKDTLLTRPSGYNIARSVRTRSSASGYFSRTPASASNRKTWTWSGWVKRGSMGAFVSLFSSTNGTNGESTKTYIAIDASDLLTVGYGAAAFFTTTQVFRDTAAWYHIVVAFDSTQATATNRVKVYVNGTQVTAYSVGTSVTLNVDSAVNFTYSHSISALTGPSNYFDGYLTEINFIDGQALTPSSFGETDSITGVWKPKAYSGSYGTNGFELNFSDNSNNTAATIGKDYSGNGNNWTPNNISVTAGATYDSMVDSPTVGATSSNYAVWNPIDHPTTFVAPTNGNLSQNCNTSSWTLCVPTFAIPDGSGLWQWEFVQTGTANGANAFGVCLTTVQASVTGSPSGRAGCSGVDNTGVTFINGSTSGSITYPTVGNTITCLYDATNRTFQVFDNGVSKGTITGLPAGDTRPFVAASSSNGSPTFVANFGQTAFSYDKNGKALNTYNLPASTITNGAAYMAATTYTGTGSSASISNSNNGVSFQPDLVWVKSRTSVDWNILFDSIRGTGKSIYSNDTTAEVTNAGSGYVSSFNSNGYSVVAGGSGITNVNGSGNTYVGWQWKAGGTSASNTNGTITSTVSVGATQGFSVATYTGNGSAGATFGHGLGVAPSFVIVKERGNANGWLCYHISTGNTGYLELDATLSFQTLSTVWNNTTPSSTVVTLGTVSNVNRSGGTFVAYCFAAVAGYSAFGSYTGNGSADGVFVYLGFRPRYVMLKCTSTGGAGYDWYIWDTSRMPYNLINSSDLQADQSSAEGASGITVPMDIVSNGFKIRTSSAAINQSSQTFIYIAFAENPFRNALAR